MRKKISISRISQTLLRPADLAQLSVLLRWIYVGPPGLPRGRSGKGLFAWHILQGSVTVTGRNMTRTARKGQWLFPPHVQFDRVFSPDARIMSVHILARWPDGRDLFEHGDPLVVSGRNTRKLERISRSLLRMIQPQARTYSFGVADSVISLESFLMLEARTRMWLLELIAILRRVKIDPWVMSRVDDRVAHARKILDDWPLQHPFSEQLLAAQVGLSVSQIDRLFTATLKITPRAYYEKRRMLVARRMLSSTTSAVKQIAYELGFRQPSHFSNWFMRQSGQFPRSFRLHGIDRASS